MGIFKSKHKRPQEAKCAAEKEATKEETIKKTNPNIIRVPKTPLPYVDMFLGIICKNYGYNSLKAKALRMESKLLVSIMVKLYKENHIYKVNREVEQVMKNIREDMEQSQRNMEEVRRQL
jgi:hypothetical protein